MKKITATFAAAIIAGLTMSAPANAAADIDPVAVNITALVEAAPAICDGVTKAVAAGQSPSLFIEPAVEAFVETYPNAVGIDILAGVYRGILVGCSAAR